MNPFSVENEDFSKNVIIAVILVAAALVSLIIGICIHFYEPPLKEGTVIGIVHQADRFFYVQEEHRKYKTVTTMVPRTTVTSDGKGHTKTSTQLVPTSHSVYDHSDWSLDEHHDGEDFVVTIQAPSKKFKDKTRTAEFYVTKARYDSLGLGDQFVYDPIETKDSDRDLNNKVLEVEYQWMFRIDVQKWLANRNIPYTPDEIILEAKP